MSVRTFLKSAAVVAGAMVAPAAFAGGGDCCSPNGTPGCSSNGCEAAICATDPFCCDTEWDSICADAANEICAVCAGEGCPGDGSCYEPNGTPGCSDAECCGIVCAADDFCCATSWDGLCSDQAFELCGNCGGGDAGSCYSPNGTPGCEDAFCCETICVADPFCCNSQWDGICASAAAVECAGCGENGSGSCFESNGTPACDDEDCCQLVCGQDPFCCDTSWDGICADAALAECAGCGEADSGSCYDSNGTPGCDDFDCCELVCAQDLFCCEVNWDGICADEAVEFCVGCGENSAGNCCESNGTPGCDDVDCCQIVCSADPFCCNTSWDSICGDAAQADCGLCDSGACCNDGVCTVVSPIVCVINGGTYQGDGVGCDQIFCGIVILFGACCFDNGSCSVLTTTACASAGGTFQGILTSCDEVDCGPCSGDADGDGDVDSTDLNLVLQGFGCVGGGCPGDVNNSGATNSTDLNIVLGNFGCGT